MATTKTQSFAGYVEVTSNLTVDTDTLHVDSVSNRVGIGKTNPQYELDIAGSINATDLYINGAAASSSPWSSNNANIYYTSGNIGISTNAPSDELDVYGSVHVSNASSSTTTSFYVSQVSEIANSQTISTNHVYTGAFEIGLNSAARVSTDSSYLIVGSPYYDSPSGSISNRGAVLMFKRTGDVWGDENFFEGEAVNNQFGASVDISNDGSYACVGAPYNTTPAPSQGAIYVYTRSGTTWSQQTKLTAPSSYPANGVGCAINKDGTIILSSTGNDTVIHWTRNTSDNTWSLTTTIPPEPGTRYVGAHNNVRLSKDDNTSYAVVGDYGTDSRGGSAFVYSRSGSTWTLDTELEASDKNGNHRNAFAVDISADTSYIITGAFLHDSAYIFRRTGSDWSSWTEEAILSAPTGDWYGQSVAINNDGSLAVVGSTAELGNDGAFYLHERTGSSWSEGTRYTWPIYTMHLGKGVYIAGTKSSNDYHYGSGRTENTGSVNYTGVVYYGTANYGALEVDQQVSADGTVLSFTGQHTCFPDGPLGQGLIVSANKNKYVSLNGPLTSGSQAIKSSESLPVVSLSNVANDTTVFGVVDHVENGGNIRSQEIGVGVVTQDKELGDNRVVVNSLGEGAMWVVNTNGNLASGDYITTSNVLGYGQKQSDSDTLHSYTVAKITMDCDFNPQDVPIQVIKKDENGQNILDSYGRIQWEDSDEMELPYVMKYITMDGGPTDEANATWKAAYVGCTYHCG